MYINVSKYIQTHSAKGQRKINKKDLKWKNKDQNVLEERKRRNASKLVKMKSKSKVNLENLW